MMQCLMPSGKFIEEKIPGLKQESNRTHDVVPNAFWQIYREKIPGLRQESNLQSSGTDPLL